MVRKKRKKKVGSSGGLGVRYGANVRKQYEKVVSGMKKPHRCPQCSSMSAQRESVGIWACKKCGLTFAGGAYTPVTKLGIVAKRSAKGAPSPEVAVKTEEE
ncbi:MAG: 50S ribosomal protein L37ae [Candidatus Bathyarchaeota archaeon]|nr:MAG: 50S ribosomal protein L37ae [Candidatus Bathyarchaeota archaeon]